MEEFTKQLATEFTQALELYREATKLLEQCEPSFAHISLSVLGTPPGSETATSQATSRREPKHIIKLMCWWALYGDFESLLPEMIPGAKRSGILAVASRDKPVAKTEFENLRTQRFGDPLHPMNWYVKCKKTSQISEFLWSSCFSEALSVYSTGGWKSLHDLSVDFFDAATRSIGLNRCVREGRVLTGSELARLSAEAGLTISIEEALVDSVSALRPLVWHSQKSKKTARPAFRVSGRYVDGVVLVARPQSFIRAASKEKGNWGPRTSEILIEAAGNNWPAELYLGEGIRDLISDPDRVNLGIPSLKSIAGLLLLAADAAKSNRTGTNDPPASGSAGGATCLIELEESLKYAKVRLHQARVRPDQIAHGVPSRTTTHEDVHLLLRLDGQDSVFGQLVRSDAPDDVFDSVLLYDLHAWAIDEVSRRSADRGCKAAIAALVQSGCWEKPWEATKKLMLALPPDASAGALQHAFSALWPSILAFRKVAAASKELPEPQREQLDTLLGDMVHATLGLLKKTGTNTYPPRFCGRENAGEIDPKRWLEEDHWWQGSPAIEVNVRSGARPQLLEVVGLSQLEIQLPGFDDRNADDARLLRMPGIFSWSHGNPPPYMRLIHEHVCQPIVVPFAHGSVAPVNFAEALQSLKRAFSVGDGKAAFNDLITAAIDGDENAVGWLECLHNDCRFQFECFPRIEKHAEKWQPCQPMPEDEHVRWAFDDERYEKTLVTVTYALSPAESVAIYSKGCQSGSRVLEAADAVQEWCDKVGKNAQGSQLHRATERYWAFSESLGQAVQIAAELLDQIGEFGCIGRATGGGEQQPAIRDDGYNRLKSWLDAIGGLVTPSSWSANTGSEVPTEHVGSLPVEFSAAVPVGRVIVNRFGVTAANFAQRFEGAVSAGAPFSGYEDIDGISRRYWAQHAVWAELAIEWSSVPAQSDNKTRLAGVLHSIYYKLAINEDEVDASDWKSDAKLRLITILEQVCGWKAFPATDEAELGPGRGQLEERKIIFADGRRASSGTVRVLAKGFEDRRGNMLQAHVERK
jgi:hypothetical protein